MSTIAGLAGSLFSQMATGWPDAVTAGLVLWLLASTTFLLASGLLTNRDPIRNHPPRRPLPAVVSTITAVASLGVWLSYMTGLLAQG